MNPGISEDAGGPAVGDGLWSTALSVDTAMAAEAMQLLAARYWYPVYAWWRRVGCTATKAASATEACLSRWIEREPARADDPGAARWRAWQLRRLPVLAVAGVKPWPAPLLSIDRAWAEERYATEPDGSPDALLARALALLVLDRAAETLREEGGDPTDSEFRERLGVLLRGIVARLLAEPADVESEMAVLRDAVGSLGDAATPLPASLAGLVPEDCYASGLAAQPEELPMQASTQDVLSIEDVSRLFPHCEILALISGDAHGSVYQARQTALDRLVAIKLLPAAAGEDREFAGRFLREAEAMARLHHENIVTVHDFGETAAGHLYVVMEFVDGAPLDARLREARLPEGAALHVATQLCAALAYAHGEGVVHGDLKPANVLLSRAAVAKVADFGVTRLAVATSGVADYLAPEQKHALAVDERADIFAAGVILYEMLCGEVPTGIFDPPSVRAGVDARLDAIVRSAMQSEPARRYQTIAEMKAGLEQVRDAPAEVPPATIEPEPVAIAAVARRPKRWWIGAAAALPLLAGVGFVALKPKNETLTAAQKVALARAAQAKFAPIAIVEATPTPTPKPKPKSKPAAKKPATAAPAAATPSPEPAPAPSTPAPMVASLPLPAATPPPAATPAPPPEPASWLATTSEQMQAAYQREVRAPFDSAIAKIRKQYVAVIDASIAAATTTARRDLVLALRAERQRVESGQPMVDDGKPPAIPELKPLRDNWRVQFAKLDKDRFERAKALLARYEPALAQRETQLTAEQKLEDLAALKARRAEIAGAWLVPPAGQSADAAPAAPIKGRLAPLPLIRSLLELNARVWVRNAPGTTRYEVKTISDLKTEKFEWDEVEFRPRAAGGAPIGDGDLAILEQLSDSPGLALEGIAITDVTIERLRALRSLRHLRLENVKGITGKSFELIAALPELTSLALINVPAGDDAIATLAPLTKLTKLRFNDLPITDASLRIVAAMPALEDLEFGGGKIRVTSAAWECIPRMHKLARLYPKGSALDGVMTGHIARCTGLTRLSFQDQPITDAALAPLSTLSRLTSLTLGGTKVSGSAFKSWPVRNNLITLHLDDCPGLDDSVLRAIATAFPKLETLEIGGAAGSINRAGVAELLKLRQLSNLRVQGDAATDNMATELARLETLTQLDLDKAALTEAGLNALAKLPKLHKLSLDNPPITDGALRAFKKFRKLREITVSPATPEAIFTRLRADLPGLSIKR